MVRKSLDLLGIMLIVAVEFMLVGAGITNSPVNVVFGVLLALVLPGYTLSAAAFRMRSVRGVERAALTLGISLSVATLGGLLLDALPGGLQTQSWLFLLGSVTVGAAAVALLRRVTIETTATTAITATNCDHRDHRDRRATAPTEDAENAEDAENSVVAEKPEDAEKPLISLISASQRLTPPLSQALRTWLSLGGLAYIIRGAPRRQILMIALAVVILFGGIVIAVNGAKQEQTATAVTQLWLLPDKTAPVDGATWRPHAGDTADGVSDHALGERRPVARVGLRPPGIHRHLGGRYHGAIRCSWKRCEGRGRPLS